MPASCELCEGAAGASELALDLGAFGGRVGSFGFRMSASRRETFGRWVASASGLGTGPSSSSSCFHCFETKLSAAVLEKLCLQARCCLYAHMLLRYFQSPLVLGSCPTRITASRSSVS